MGGFYSSRIAKIGEEYAGGNDIADGKNCFETFVRILSDIVSIEILEIPFKQVIK